MAEKREKKEKVEAKPKPIDPYLYYKIVGEWNGAILGVSPARPTMPDHLAKLVRDEEERLARELRKQRPSEARAAKPAAAEAPEKKEEGSGEVEEEVQQEVKSQRRQWLETALHDPALDKFAKAVIKEALRDLDVPSMINRTIMRATSTFPRNGTGDFIVPAAWFYGALKAAVRRDLGKYREQAQEIVRGCVSVYPDHLDLRTKEPDAVEDANVPLPSSRPGEAQSTIKRFHAVYPRRHGVELFTIVVKVLDSPFAKEFSDNIQRIFTVVGNSGLGGGRPNFGTFDLVECAQLKGDEARGLMTELAEAA